MKHVLGAMLAIVVASTAAVDNSRSLALTAALQSHVERGDVPAVMAIVVDADRIVYLGGGGKRDVANNLLVDKDSIFRIASMTKPVTSLAIMMLFEEGRLSFDDPVSKYLPEADRARVMTDFRPDGTYDSRPPAKPITVRHLLTHTSGIGYGFIDPRLAKLDDGSKNDLELPLLHDPGERFTYGMSTRTLGRIVEAISGKPLDVFLQERIFTPLGMSDTSYAVPPEKRDRVVTQHNKSNGSFTEVANPANVRSPVRGDGGLFSTVLDYGRFMQLFLNGGRVASTRLVTERSINMMMSNQIGPLRVESQPASPPFPFGAGKDSFGFGFQIEGKPAAAGTRGVGAASWGGIYNTHFWIDRRKGIAAAVMMQFLPYYDSAAIAVLRDFERAVYAK